MIIKIMGMILHYVLASITNIQIMTTIIKRIRQYIYKINKNIGFLTTTNKTAGRTISSRKNEIREI